MRWREIDPPGRAVVDERNTDERRVRAQSGPSSRSRIASGSRIRAAIHPYMGRSRVRSGDTAVQPGGDVIEPESSEFECEQRSQPDTRVRAVSLREHGVDRQNTNLDAHPTYTPDLTRSEPDRPVDRPGRQSDAIGRRRRVRLESQLSTRTRPSTIGSHEDHDPYIATETASCGRSRGCTPITRGRSADISSVRASLTRDRRARVAEEADSRI